MLAATTSLRKTPVVTEPSYSDAIDGFQATQNHSSAHVQFQILTAADKIQEFVVEVIKARQEIELQSKDFPTFGKAYIAVSALDREIRTWYQSLAPELSRSALNSVNTPVLLFIIQYVLSYRRLDTVLT